MLATNPAIVAHGIDEPTIKGLTAERHQKAAAKLQLAFDAIITAHSFDADYDTLKACTVRLGRAIWWHEQQALRLQFKLTMRPV